MVRIHAAVGAVPRRSPLPYSSTHKCTYALTVTTYPVCTASLMQTLGMCEVSMRHSALRSIIVYARHLGPRLQASKPPAPPPPCPLRKSSYRVPRARAATIIHSQIQEFYGPCSDPTTPHSNGKAYERRTFSWQTLQHASIHPDPHPFSPCICIAGSRCLARMLIPARPPGTSNEPAASPPRICGAE